MVLYIINGAMGSGKTLIETILAYFFKIQYNIPVYSNYTLKFGTKISPLDLLTYKYNNCVICLDELHTIFDSRVSGRKVNRLGSYFIAQTRKKNIIFIGTSQLNSSVDLRFTDLADYTILSIAHQNYFEYYISDKIRWTKKILPVEYAKQFYSLFDTFEVIIPLESDKRVSIAELQKLYNAAPNQTAFRQITKAFYPQFSSDEANASFTLIKNNKLDLLQKLISNIY